MSLATKLAKDLKHSSILKEAASSQKNSAKSSWIFSNEAMFSFRPCTWVEAYWKKNRAH